MKKEKSIEYLNEKLNKLKKFNKKGVPLCNKIFFSILGVTFVSMLVSATFPSTIFVYASLLGLTLVSGSVNGIIQFIDYEKKINKLTNQIEELREKECVKTMENVTKKLEKEVKQKMQENQNKNQGYSRTKVMKIYAEKVKELENEEIENSLN